MPAASHQTFYEKNTNYASFLGARPVELFSKYADTLKPDDTTGLALDVGCGVGQVLQRIHQAGYAAQGIDVCEPAILEGRAKGLPCQLYDGKTIPYPDNTFASVGALNVLEHVDQPEAFIEEVVRVARPGGKVVISSPNFLRVIGFRDYHPHMRGIINKARNLGRLLVKVQRIRSGRESRFDRMTPIVRPILQSDDDAIIATNPLEIASHLSRNGCAISSISCSDRAIHPIIDFFLNATPLRYAMFNGFVIARKN